MVWSIRKIPSDPNFSATNPNAQMISDVVCPRLGLDECGKPLFL